MNLTLGIDYPCGLRDARNAAKVIFGYRAMFMVGEIEFIGDVCTANRDKHSGPNHCLKCKDMGREAALFMAMIARSLLLPKPSI